MKNLNKFAQSEMSEAQEKKYIENLYDGHYDSKLKKEYADILASKYDVSRNESTVKEVNKPSKIKYFTLISAAIAAIFALVLVFIPILNESITVDPQQYAQSLILVDKMDVKRGQQEDSQLNQKIKQSYNTEKWAEVIALYDQKSELTSEDIYYKAKTYLHLKEYTLAIEHFQKISDPETFKYSGELPYWLSIAYVSINEFGKAKPILEKIAQSNWKAREARELLSNIK